MVALLAALTAHAQVIGLIVGHIVVCRSHGVALCSIVGGFACSSARTLQGSFYVTFYVAVAGMLVAMAAVVPDWPYLNRNPILFTLDSPDDKDD